MLSIIFVAAGALIGAITVFGVGIFSALFYCPIWVSFLIIIFISLVQCARPSKPSGQALLIAIYGYDRGKNIAAFLFTFFLHSLIFGALNAASYYLTQWVIA